MSAPLFRVLVDFSGVGNYTDLSGGGTGYPNQAGFVQNFTVRLGFQGPRQYIAAAGQANVTLYNGDRRFSPAYQQGPYYNNLVAQLPVLIYIYDDAGNALQIFNGYLDDLAPAGDDKGTRLAKLQATDLLGLMQNVKVNLPLQINKTGDILTKGLVNTVLGAPMATQTVALTALPANNDTLTLNDIILTLSTTTPAVTPGQVYLGVNPTASATNLVAAINQIAGLNTLYGATNPPTGMNAIQNKNYYLVVQADAPVRYYRVAEPSGTTAIDVGVWAANGTYNGGFTLNQSSPLGEVSDKAVAFNGTTGYINCPGLTQMVGGPFSIECWIKETTPGTFYDFFGVYSASNGNYYVLRVDSTGHLEIQATTALGFNALISTSTIASGVATHVIVSLSASGVATMYLNGVNAGGGGTTGLIAAGSSLDLTIGKSTVSGAFFTGTLDEVAIYNYDLSATQAATHYAAASIQPGFLLQALIAGADANNLAISKSSSAITLGGTTLAGGQDWPLNNIQYDTGIQTFPYGGQTWQGNKTSAYSAVEEVARSEYGRFFVRGSGQPVWRNQRFHFTHLVDSVALQIGLGQPSAAPDGQMGRNDTFRTVRITARPPTTTATGVVAKANASLLCPGKATVTFNLPFADPATGQPCGATNLVLPIVAGTDWTANEKKDNTGASYTFDPSLTFAYKLNSTSIDVIVSNAATGPLYLNLLNVRGKAIVQYNPVTATATDVPANNPQTYPTYPLELTLSDNSAYAASLAQYLLSLYKISKYRVLRLPFPPIFRDIHGHITGGGGMATTLMRLDIESLIRISDYQTGIANSLYEVIGLEYTLAVDGGLRITAIVQQLDDVTYWILNSTSYSALALTTRLAI